MLLYYTLALIKAFAIGVFSFFVAVSARDIYRWRRNRRDFPAATARAVRRDRRASRLNLNAVNRNRWRNQ